MRLTELMPDETIAPQPEQPEQPQQPATADSAARSGEPDWQRRKRLEAVFGDVLPEMTSDERDSGDVGEADNDRWLRAQVPPHHG